MSDQIFQVPPKAPSFNKPQVPNQQEENPGLSSEKQQNLSASMNNQSIPSSVEEVQKTEDQSVQQSLSGNEAMTSLNQQDSVHNENLQNPAQVKMEELRQKLSKIDLTQLKEKIQKRLWGVLGGCFIIGMMFGCSISGDEAQPVQTHGLELSKITKQNTDAKNPLYRCGRAKKLTDACFYYIMNEKSYERKAEDFFAEVADKTERQSFGIQMANPTYGQQLIPPGTFAQIIVPSFD